MNREKIPTNAKNLLLVLEALDITYKLHNHAPIFSVEEGIPLKNQIPGTHCRNLFLRDKKERMVLVTAANETKIDLKNLENHLKSARFSFGSSERLAQYLGIYPGAVNPFCVINDKNHNVEVVLDAFMMQAGIINVHPMDNAMTISLSPASLLKFLNHTGHTPNIIDFSAQSA